MSSPRTKPTAWPMPREVPREVDSFGRCVIPMWNVREMGAQGAGDEPPGAWQWQILMVNADSNQGCMVDEWLISSLVVVNGEFGSSMSN